MEKLYKIAPFPIWGIIGTTLIGICTLIPAIFYTGSNGESYSIQNHFISELGELGISDLAWCFNIGLILSGLFLILFMIGLAVKIQTKIGYFAMIAGLISSISCILVGLVPMNYKLGHGIVAMGFFFGGMIAVLLFVIDIFQNRKKQIPRIFGYLGVIVVVCFALFLVTTIIQSLDQEWILNPTSLQRPVFWILPFLEWMVFFAVNGWILTISTYYINKSQSNLMMIRILIRNRTQTWFRHFNLIETIIRKKDHS